MPGSRPFSPIEMPTVARAHDGGQSSRVEEARNPWCKRVVRGGVPPRGGPRWQLLRHCVDGGLPSLGGANSNFSQQFQCQVEGSWPTGRSFRHVWHQVEGGVVSIFLSVLGRTRYMSLRPCCAVRAMGVAGTIYIDYLGGKEQQHKMSFVSAVDVFLFRHLDTSGDLRTCPRPHPQRYTDRFIAYVDELKLTWDNQEPEHGISLAVSVVRELRGPSKAGCGRDQEKGREPAWLELKWGIALAARALDVKTAPTNLPSADMVRGLSVC